MRNILKLFLFVVFSSSVFTALSQSDSSTTFILLRHAEKDTAGGRDPQLSDAGKARAARIPGLFNNITPNVMYSTPYRRTMQTLKPWADIAGASIVPYDPTQLANFAEELKKIKGKTVVVSGHSNTAPILANLLAGTNKYSALDESDYSTLWVITITNSKAIDKVIKY